MVFIKQAKIWLPVFLTLACFSSLAQEQGYAYFNISANSYNFPRRFDPVSTVSISGNVKLNKKMALGLGTSLAVRGEAKTGYKPYYGNASYFIKEHDKTLLIADLQLGYADFQVEKLAGYSPASTVVRSTTGGLYIAPGIAYHFRLSDYFAPYIKVALVNSSFTLKETTITNGNQPQVDKITKVVDRYSQAGAMFSLGCKLF